MKVGLPLPQAVQLPRPVVYRNARAWSGPLLLLLLLLLLVHTM
jgi:hypothetical protein